MGTICTEFYRSRGATSIEREPKTAAANSDGHKGQRNSRRLLRSSSCAVPVGRVEETQGPMFPSQLRDTGICHQDICYFIIFWPLLLPLLVGCVIEQILQNYVAGDSISQPFEGMVSGGEGLRFVVCGALMSLLFGSQCTRVLVLRRFYWRN